MSPESLAILKRWESEKIKQLGAEGFERYRKELFTRGKLLHNNIQTYLETKDTTKLKFNTKAQENMWRSIECVLKNINSLFATELPVYHPILRFRGILDNLAIYDDIPVLIEWKTSEKSRPTIAQTYDYPLQAVAYYSCLQFDQSGIKQSKSIKDILLIIAYEDGSEATIHNIEPNIRETIWRKFVRRLELYWKKTSLNL
ncbi:Mitochondrial genome maintenance exonuclease 1 [Sarcoptes scabiei]|nr:Mitochondrial genome maintenance exonuclease 1 [Sarcoptes scabiei]KPM02563.1 hypothetical protein QR98_0009780 [Sarcoptes scabiei]